MAATNGRAADGQVSEVNNHPSAGDASARNGVGGGSAAPDGATANPGAHGADLDPATLKRIAEVRARVLSTFGQITLMLTAVPRYRHQSIADLHHLVLEPLVRDRVAIAKAKPKAESQGGAGGSADDTMPIVGIAIWATVSDEVHAAIREQIKAGVFPVRLKANDWTSGKTMWLLDLIAPDRNTATSVLANFQQIAKNAPVHIHPVVTRLVDPEFLKKVVTPVPASGDQPVVS